MAFYRQSSLAGQARSSASASSSGSKRPSDGCEQITRTDGADCRVAGKNFDSVAMDCLRMLRQASSNADAAVRSQRKEQALAAKRGRRARQDAEKLLSTTALLEIVRSRGDSTEIVCRECNKSLQTANTMTQPPPAKRARCKKADPFFLAPPAPAQGANKKSIGSDISPLGIVGAPLRSENSAVPSLHKPEDLMDAYSDEGADSGCEDAIELLERDFLEDALESGGPFEDSSGTEHVDQDSEAG